MENIKLQKKYSYGAVVIAAGMSKRMGQFKPILPLGDRSMIKHITDTFSLCGINEITVVSGNKAESLREHLKDEKVTVVFNENYETAQMIDSAVIGLKHLLNNRKCDRIFFTTADIPLFSEKTVVGLMACDCSVVYPCYRQRKGHPLLLDNKTAEFIVSYKGENGIKGAIEACRADTFLLEVDDPGILMDADTPADYEKLLEYEKSLR